MWPLVMDVMVVYLDNLGKCFLCRVLENITAR